MTRAEESRSKASRNRFVGVFVWLAALLAPADVQAQEREAQLMAGFAEDRFESLVFAARHGAPPDEATAAFEAASRDRALQLWQRMRAHWPEGLPPPPEDVRIEVRMLADQPVPMAIFGRGKILVDRHYASLLDAAALDAALAHELAHLGLGHARRRLSLGMAMMGDETPRRVDRRMQLALRLSDSAVESRIMEREADEMALRLLQGTGARGAALVDALEALRGYSTPEQWWGELAPRIAHLRQLAAW